MIAAECGDSAACRELVEAFLPNIAGLSRSFQGSRVEYRELLQEGVAGLLFIAATSFDRKMHAYDKRTGKLLWEAELPFAGGATPSLYMVNGREYLVIACGGGK